MNSKFSLKNSTLLSKCSTKARVPTVGVEQMRSIFQMQFLQESQTKLYRHGRQKLQTMETELVDKELSVLPSPVLFCQCAMYLLILAVSLLTSQQALSELIHSSLKLPLQSLRFRNSRDESIMFFALSIPLQ